MLFPSFITIVKDFKVASLQLKAADSLFPREVYF